MLGKRRPDKGLPDVRPSRNVPRNPARNPKNPEPFRLALGGVPRENLGSELGDSARLEKTLRIELALQREQMIVRLAVQCPIVLFTQLVPTIAIRSAAELHAFLQAA